MNDQELRDLERRWRQTGSVEDEAALLRGRVRAGTLTGERLDYAARAGHAAAAAVTGKHADLDELRKLLCRADTDERRFLRVVVALGCAEAAKECWTAADGSPRPVEVLEHALREAEVALEGRAENLAFVAADEADNEASVVRPIDPRWARAARIVAYATYLAAGVDERWAGTHEPRYLDDAIDLVGRASVLAALAHRMAVTLVTAPSRADPTA